MFEEELRYEELKEKKVYYPLLNVILGTSASFISFDAQDKEERKKMIDLIAFMADKVEILQDVIRHDAGEMNRLDKYKDDYFAKELKSILNEEMKKIYFILEHNNALRALKRRSTFGEDEKEQAKIILGQIIDGLKLLEQHAKDRGLLILAENNHRNRQGNLRDQMRKAA